MQQQQIGQVPTAATMLILLVQQGTDTLVLALRFCWETKRAAGHYLSTAEPKHVNSPYGFSTCPWTGVGCIWHSAFRSIYNPGIILSGRSWGIGGRRGTQPLEVRRAALLNVSGLRIERSNACLIRRLCVQTGTKPQQPQHTLGINDRS